MSMVDGSSLGLPLITALFALVSLLITWVRGVDPLVSLSLLTPR
jgi:hypothetical protein